VIGGGPNAAERRATEQADRRAEEQAALQRQYMDAASKPDPLEERLKAQDMSWLDFEDSTGAGRDVSKAPLGPALGLYDRAVNQQQGERAGIGALRMGLNASDPNLALQLNQQSRDRQQQQAAGDLENAVRMKSAEVHGSALPLLGMGQNRRMGLAELGSGNANTSQGQYLGWMANRPQRNSFWRTFSQNFGGSFGSWLGGGG